MTRFLSCDWGTTAFRIRLIEASTLTILEEENSNEGIAVTFRKWQQQQANEEERLPFYIAVIHAHLHAMQQRLSASLQGIPLIISGMASSTIGMVELPCKPLPFAANGSDLNVHTIKNSSFGADILMISGARTDNDVMRGEETKLIGAVNGELKDDRLFIFPGTHPKHVLVKDGKAVAFKTFMTGEFFELLSNKSILAVSVEKGQSLQDGDNLKYFEQGVKQGSNNILHSCFRVRTNQVFNKLTKPENYHYLSGLLIGSELTNEVGKNQQITIAANAVLSGLYGSAIKVLNPSISVSIQDADKALLKGQFIVAGMQKI